jgi:hypothetical protein
MVRLAAALYFGGGTAYRRLTRGAKGWDALPHAGLWRELWALVSDGVAFSRARASGGDGGLRKCQDVGSATKKERLLEPDVDSSKRGKREKREKREKRKRKEAPWQPEDSAPAALEGVPKTTPSGGGGKWVHVPT